MIYFDNTIRPLDHMHPPATPHDPKLAESRRNHFAVRANVLSKVLNDRDYILGFDFSGADILIGRSRFMATFTARIRDHPIVEAYYERLNQRPGHQRAYDS